MSTNSIEIGGLGIGVERARTWLREIDRLEKRYGRKLTDEDVFEAARDPKSSFHSFVFNVDKDKAALSYYMGRVQYITRNIAAITMLADGSKAKIRMLLRTQDGFERVTEIEPKSVREEEIQRQLLLRIISAQRQAEAFRVIVGAKANAILEHLKQAEEAVKKSVARSSKRKSAA